MGKTQQQIKIDVFNAANIISYADTLNYNSLISALETLVCIYEENIKEDCKQKIDINDFNFVLCSIIHYCGSVEALRQEVENALKDKDLKPFY